MNGIGNTMNNGRVAFDNGLWCGTLRYTDILYDEFDKSIYSFYPVLFTLPDWDNPESTVHHLDLRPLENVISNLSIYQERIYFRLCSNVDYGTESTYEGECGAIYSIGVDGSDLKMLTDDPTDIFYIYDGYIYYQVTQLGRHYDSNFNEIVPPETEKTQIYRIALDGSEKELLYYGEEPEGWDNNNDRPFSFGLFSVFDGRLYIPIQYEGITCVDLETGDVFEIYNIAEEPGLFAIERVIPTESGIIIEAWFSREQWQLFRMDFNGGNIEPVTTRYPIHIFTISGDWIYYTAEAKHSYDLRKIRCDGNEDEFVLAPGIWPEHLVVANGMVFLEVWHLEFYYLPEDGSRPIENLGVLSP